MYIIQVLSPNGIDYSLLASTDTFADTIRAVSIIALNTQLIDVEFTVVGKQKIFKYCKVKKNGLSI